MCDGGDGWAGSVRRRRWDCASDARGGRQSRGVLERDVDPEPPPAAEQEQPDCSLRRPVTDANWVFKLIDGYPDTDDVAPIGRSLADRVYGATDPLGWSFQTGGREVTVVRVVGDVAIETRRPWSRPTPYSRLRRSGLTKIRVSVPEVEMYRSSDAAPFHHSRPRHVPRRVRGLSGSAARRGAAGGGGAGEGKGGGFRGRPLLGSSAIGYRFLTARFFLAFPPFPRIGTTLPSVPVAATSSASRCGCFQT